MTGDDLAIVVPVWRRTKHIARVYESIMAATPYADVLFVVSFDDDEVRDVLEKGGLGISHLVVDWRGGSRGDYNRKINAGYRATDRPVIFTGADDLDFAPDWYEQARPLLDVPTETISVMAGGGILIGPGEIPRIGVVGTVDDCNGRTMEGRHSTHSLVARWYADQGGSADQAAMIYHEGYWHEYGDDELVQTAMARQAYAHAFGAHVAHLHHLVGKSPVDDVYEHGRAHTAESRAMFRGRQRLWLRQRRNVQYPRRAVPR